MSGELSLVPALQSVIKESWKRASELDILIPGRTICGCAVNFLERGEVRKKGHVDQGQSIIANFLRDGRDGSVEISRSFISR